MHEILAILLHHCVVLAIQQDCVTLDFVRQQLEDCTTLHGSVCSGKPVFSFETTLGTQNIIMNCTQCDFMYIIV